MHARVHTHTHTHTHTQTHNRTWLSFLLFQSAMHRLKRPACVAVLKCFSSLIPKNPGLWAHNIRHQRFQANWYVNKSNHWQIWRIIHTGLDLIMSHNHNVLFQSHNIHIIPYSLIMYIVAELAFDSPLTTSEGVSWSALYSALTCCLGVLRWHLSPLHSGILCSKHLSK